MSKSGRDQTSPSSSGFIRAELPVAKVTGTKQSVQDNAPLRGKAIKAYETQVRLFKSVPRNAGAEDGEPSLKELSLEDLLDSDRKAA